MPINEPPTKQDFIDRVSDSLWRGGVLVDPVSDDETRVGVINGRWVLLSSGNLLTESAFVALKGAKAQDDGSFIAQNGNAYRLCASDGQVTAVQKK